MHHMCDANDILCLSFYDCNLSRTYQQPIYHDNGEYWAIATFSLEAESLVNARRGTGLQKVRPERRLLSGRNL